MIYKIIVIFFMSTYAFANTYWDKGLMDSKPDNNLENPYDLKAQIVHSIKGRKMIGFSLFPKANTKECNDETKNDKFESIIFYVNNQAIKGSLWCETYSNSNNKLYFFSANTDLGNSFVIESFKKSRLVSVEVKSYKYEFIAYGFTSAWNVKEGNAL